MLVCVRPRRLPVVPGVRALHSRSFLGQNSKRQRLQRELVDLQTRMRLRSSGTKDDVRQNYLSALLAKLADPLVQHAQGGIDEVIDTMDDYFLIPEDRDTAVELEVGEAPDTREDRLKKLPAPVKAAFTRAYNGRSQYVACSRSPVAFQRTANVPAAAQKTKALRAEGVPDNEEAYGVRVLLTQVDEEVAEPADVVSDEEDTKDPLVRATASKPKGKRKAKGA